MPARYIREGLLDSDRIARAGEPAEILFVRLMLTVDDFARGDARPKVIQSKCWPAGDELEGTSPSLPEIEKRFKALATERVVIPYQVDGKPYFYIPNFKQRSRAMKSKFPDPPKSNGKDDGGMPDNSPTERGQFADRSPRHDGGPQAVSGSVSVSYSSADDRSVSNKSRTTRRQDSSGVAKTQQQIAENDAARARATPMPEQLRTFLPKKPEEPFRTPPVDDFDTPGEDMPRA